MLPGRRLFVEDSEAESVKLGEMSVLSCGCWEVGQNLTAGSLGTTTMTVAKKLIIKYVRS